MKKFISLTVAVIMLLTFSMTVFAVSINSSKNELREQFEYGCGPKAGAYAIDYRYYSPVQEDDTEKYPLVIWVHGHSHGQYEGYQIISNDIVNWSSEEFQSRSEKGFYIMAVRAPENLGISWGDDLVGPLKAAIDDFVEKNKENIDLTKIYIGGFSLGGMMTFKMAINYPEMFAAIFPICPYIAINEDQAEKFSDVPVWLVSGKNDPLVGYKNKTLKNWTAVCETTDVPEECRFSLMSKVCSPDGSSSPTEHYSWEAVTYDMFTTDNGDYYNTTTTDANGNTVVLTYPDGMISWLMSHTSDYDIEDSGNNNNTTSKVNVFNIIKAPIMAVYIVIRNIFRPLFG